VLETTAANSMTLHNIFAMSRSAGGSSAFSMRGAAMMEVGSLWSHGRRKPPNVNQASA